MNNIVFFTDSEATIIKSIEQKYTSFKKELLSLLEKQNTQPYYVFPKPGHNKMLYQNFQAAYANALMEKDIDYKKILDGVDSVDQALEQNIDKFGGIVLNELIIRLLEHIKINGYEKDVLKELVDVISTRNDISRVEHSYLENLYTSFLKKHIALTD